MNKRVYPILIGQPQGESRSKLCFERGIKNRKDFLALGLSLLVGDGTAANFSLECGRRKRDRADKSVGNGFLLLVILSLLLCLMGFIFKSQILKLFGANPEEKVCYDFAVQYFTVICAGLPFYMIGQGMNASIRADGSPKYAMACTLAGAMANLILDPLFIFAFNMGVKGAAIATVMGQACLSALLFLLLL